MKWSASLVVVFVAIVAALPRGARAETWCGDGPGTALNHPCTDADDIDNPAVEAAIKKYQYAWIQIDGVAGTEEAETYNSRPASIQVAVEPKWMKAARKRIPSSVNGIPVVIVPGEIAHDGLIIGSFPVDPDVEARKQKIADENETSDAVIEAYGDRWNDLPGVISVDQRCKQGDDDEPCRYRNITVVVQHEFLSSVQSEVPASVKGVPIKVVPDP